MVPEQPETDNNSIILEYFNDQYAYRGRHGYYHTVGELHNNTDVDGILKGGSAPTQTSSNSHVSSTRTNYSATNLPLNGINMTTNTTNVNRKDVTDDQSLSLTSRGITLALGTYQSLH